MSIAIRREKCIGCKKCLSVCPGSLIKIGKEGKAYIKYPEDCWGCCSCIKECKSSAIAFYLGADIGGQGSVMTVNEVFGIITWRVESTDGKIDEININPKDSNKY